ncbi:MAG: ABC transporter substrate-binding protein [Bacteroidales bacterium]|nr:ABC transporter substrate-binding protein [Bacteroidales bacterium]
MKKYFLPLVVCLCLLASCRLANSNNTATQNDADKTASSANITLQHSSLLRISTADSCRIVEVRNPADTAKISRRYILVPNNQTPQNLPVGTIIRVPLRNALICTSLHAGLFKTLGATEEIGGVCDAKYVIDSTLQLLIKKEKIKDCGYTANPDREKILTLAPDAVLMSPYDGMQTTGFYGATNIPVVDCVDYMENTPLGQAEWIKFYGILTGKEREADSIYEVVKRNYEEVFLQVSLSSYRPTLLTEKMYQQTWYVPTGRSTSGVFYKDAGFFYVFDDLTAENGRVSVPLTFEQVYAKAHDADFWIFKYYGENQTLTLDLLAAENPNYKDFKAFKSGKIYACNTWATPYYDVTPFRPDILLRELAYISNPQWVKDYTPQFFQQLQ